MSTFEIMVANSSATPIVLTIEADAIQVNPIGVLGVIDRDGDPVALFHPNGWLSAQRTSGEPVKIIQFPKDVA